MTNPTVMHLAGFEGPEGPDANEMWILESPTPVATLALERRLMRFTIASLCGGRGPLTCRTYRRIIHGPVTMLAFGEQPTRIQLTDVEEARRRRQLRPEEFLSAAQAAQPVLPICVKCTLAADRFESASSELVPLRTIGVAWGGRGGTGLLLRMAEDYFGVRNRARDKWSYVVELYPATRAPEFAAYVKNQQRGAA